tara:strand:+ start:118 stop:585 length:468 start_codon:yes stop_codon:yes gene_type:complete
MAAFKIRSTLVSMQSKLAAMGNVYHAQIGEPMKPFTPSGSSKRVAAAVWMNDWNPTLTLATSVEVFVVTVRLHVDALKFDEEQIELDLADTVNEFTTDVQQDFDLGATIRNVDIGGEMSEGMSTAWGRVTIAGEQYRVADVIVPMIVNDVATQAA